MGKNLEIEAKALLTENEYKNLCSYFVNAKRFEQINFYYDTKDFKILRNRCGLRVRKELDCYELTLKEKSGEGRLEHNQKITAKQADLFKNCGVFPCGEVLDRVNELFELSAKEITCFGELKNTRLEVEKDGRLVCLDKSEYCRIIDYEIEVESSSIKDAIEYLKSLLNSNGIEYKENRINKIERLVNAVSK